MSKITHVDVRMYRIGTGDCFLLKFYNGPKDTDVCFKMLIDAGAWSGGSADVAKYIEHLKLDVGGVVDVLVVTHEHKDHVHAFDVCSDLFTNNFKVGELWLAWTESDKSSVVKDWKKKYGEHKKALGIAAQKLGLALSDKKYRNQFKGNRFGAKALKAREGFGNIVKDLADLHLSLDGNVYKGGLAGMEVVKNKIKRTAVRYFSPGKIMSEIEGLTGVKIYVLGPPKSYADVKKESGGKGESYDHNNVLQKSGAFGAAILNMDSSDVAKKRLLPFDECYVAESGSHSKEESDLFGKYDSQEWRKIDYDWLYSSGSYALRMNGLTNNLSLAMAFEFEESGRVMLFPGDAEYGSWQSWHDINWGETGRDGKPLVEDLLNRTVFYKVAHHLSHNGTAQKLGLEMMNHKDLVAMATLDYNIISSGWKGTMPNRAIIKELLRRTKGRLIILRNDDLFYDFHEQMPMADKVEEARQAMSKKERDDFKKAYVEDALFLQYRVKA